MTTSPAPKRIAIVTASPPGENGVGQNYMRDLVDAIGPQHTHVFAILKQESEWRSEDRASSAANTLLSRRYEYPRGFGPGRLHHWTANLAFRTFTVPHARGLSQQIAQQLAAHQCDTVLVVLESPLLMLIGECLGHQIVENRLNASLRLLVWDHPEHIAAAFGHRGRRASRIQLAFRRVVAQAAGGLTVAPALKDLVKEINPSLPIDIFRSPSSFTESPSDEQPINNDPSQAPFVFGFAGSVTAPDELESFQRCLDQMDWQVDGRPIVFRLFGKRFTLSASARRNVQYCGFLPTQSDVVRALGSCDVCFLPQPFSADQRLVAEYSFPTKLSSYLSSGRPVLVFAPPYASLAKFQHDRNPQANFESALGFRCETADQDQLIQLIRRLVVDESFFSAGIDRARDTASELFRADAGAQKVKLALGAV